MSLCPDAAGNVLGLCGGTPAVWIHGLVPGSPTRVLAKCEYLTPGGSLKDRVAKHMVAAALADGRVRPGDTAVELTSGNMGIGLSIACRQAGLRFVAVMSRGNSIERARMMQALGAEVELVDQAPGSQAGQVSGADLELVSQRTAELVAELGAWHVNQFENPDNVASHERTTGPEIVAQCQGAPDAFVMVAGTGCTFVGTMRYLRWAAPDCRGYVVEPAGAAVLAGQPITAPNHKLQGIGYAKVPAQWQPELCDGCLAVTDDEAIAMARRLAGEYGLLVGFSAGANLAACAQLAAADDPPAVIASLLCDSGLKYLSTDLWG